MAVYSGPPVSTYNNIHKFSGERTVYLESAKSSAAE
jgi:hypothetical protein